MLHSNVSNLIYGYEFIYKETLQETQMLFTLMCIISDAYNFRITAYLLCTTFFYMSDFDSEQVCYSTNTLTIIHGINLEKLVLQ